MMAQPNLEQQRRQIGFSNDDDDGVSGNIALVGAAGEENAGTVYVYVRSGALDGDTAVLGAVGDDDIASDAGSTESRID
jgi:hypothetical protein